MHPVSAPANCPFCQPSVRLTVFWENENFLALYNIAPILPGHSLVIPRKHVTSLLDLSNEEFQQFFLAARRAIQILMQAFHTNAFDWSIQEKPEAGQTLEHIHLHIVPRERQDLSHPGNWYPRVHKNDPEIIDSLDRPRISESEMQAIVERLRAEALK
jgi:bis(5'-adenosyl)-triphosphatase